MKRVMNAELSGRILRGRPKYGYVVGVMAAFLDRDICVEEALGRARDRSVCFRIVNG